MKERKTLPWIEGAYHLVAEKGLGSLNVEVLARRLSRSKSSFYHYFGDLDNFKDQLLAYHIQRSTELAELIYACEKLKPDVLNVFLQRQADIFFHKHLRFKREVAEFRACYEKAYSTVEQGILEQWISFLQLSGQPFFAKAFLTLISENFLLRITASQYNYSWLENYLEEVRYLLQQANPNS
ncbi:MAG: TetR/AcrR family transcriptional regulator [Saprospiraceae bacterium]|nr:TetR/AcrR family transcriptional regulator [Saprospiraceae bacterium]